MNPAMDVGEQQLPVAQLPPYQWENLYPGRDKLPEAPPWNGGPAVRPMQAASGEAFVQAPQWNGPPAPTHGGAPEPRQAPGYTLGGEAPFVAAEPQAGAYGAGPVAAGPDGYYPVEPSPAAGVRREPYVPVPMEGYAVGSTHQHSTATNRASAGFDSMPDHRSASLGIPGFGAPGMGSFGAGSFNNAGGRNPIASGLPATAGLGLSDRSRAQPRQYR